MYQRFGVPVDTKKKHEHNISKWFGDDILENDWVNMSQVNNISIQFDISGMKVTDDQKSGNLLGKMSIINECSKK